MRNATSHAQKIYEGQVNTYNLVSVDQVVSEPQESVFRDAKIL